MIFMALIPITEWPDSYENISRAAYGLKSYPLNAAYLNEIIADRNPLTDRFFFGDLYFFKPKLDYYLSNIERLPIVLGMLATLYFGASKNKSKELPFTPPLVFAICAPSQEAIAIFILTLAFVLSEYRKTAPIILCGIALALDRSMLPEATFLLLILIFPFFRRLVLSPRSVITAMLFLAFFCNYFKASEIFSIHPFDQIKIMGISHWDIEYFADSGKNNIKALATSIMGLYGWMSIRPYPFWIYYCLIGSLFAIGFIRVSWSTRSFFCSLFIPSYIVMWLIPTLSQARYYPLLTIVFWSITFFGAQSIKFSKSALSIFILLSTFIGCVVALFINSL
jgi:hypothetical protein